MADQRYYNMNAKGEDNRYKVNTNILRMMQANPALGTGYIIGSMLGENYWGKKRAKREQIADRKGRGEDGSVGADANGVYGTKSNGAVNEIGGSVGSMGALKDWAARNSALEEYKNNPNGKVLYGGLNSGSNPFGVNADAVSGNYPRTPAQNNQAGITVGNVANGGGTPNVGQMWENMKNASTYNPGSTGMYTNGARNLGNVIGADANGVYGVGGSGAGTPSVANFPQKPANGPAPYTDDQLRQIQGQNFTAEELAKMASPQELARMVVMARGGAAPTGGGVLTSAAERYAPAPSGTPTAPQVPANIDKIIAGDDEIYEYGNPFAGQSTPLPVSRRGTRAMAAAWQQDPNIMNVANNVSAPQLVYPNDEDPRLKELAANLQYGDR